MTDFAFGRNRTLGFCIEGTAGVYTPDDYNQAWGSPTLKVIGFMEVTPKPNNERIIEPHMSGRPELTPQDIAEGINNSLVTVRMKCPKENLAWFMLGLFGNVTTTGSVIPYTHVFIPSLTSGYPASFKLEYRKPLNITETRLQLQGCKIKSMTFELKLNAMVIVVVEFIGGSWTKSTTLGSAPTTLEPISDINPFWNFKDFTSANHDFAIGDWPNTTWVEGFYECTLKFENMLAEDINDSYELGSAERKRLERSAEAESIKLTGTVKRLLKDKVAFDWWKGLNTLKFIAWSYSNIYQLGFHSWIKLLNTPISEARGFGLINEIIEFQSIYNPEAVPTPGSLGCTIEDTQATPITQGT